ncbi:carbohydrate kinase [Methyloceanibacter marginalis]|jgi:sugar/nucleoside kinase (ribokinase family)|uniref:Carbohydrate kinase n=1 Tax=Methyloceanibacter marginalis TaxID=1774971 RepID=A0A1E3WB20_9HYPH|nr:adenosine kinase [Methyloceanibacter marginalis]ODS03005.1 carbohydrate kinase [Methyloceanibacter marginalis]
MAEKIYDVVGIGNAIVDIIARCDDGFLSKHDLDKGFMRLIDADEAAKLYEAMGPATERSGGSVANSIAGLASFGAKCGFIGRVAADQFGGIFRHDIRSLGIAYTTDPAEDGAPTARCLVLVTPDGERTMNTFLGASVDFAPGDLDPDLIEGAKIVYLEGYLFDKDAAKSAFREAAKRAKAAGAKVALTLSDPFCVERHRDDFRKLVSEDADIVFANEKEITTLYEVNSFDEAADAALQDCELAVLTRSEDGSMILGAGETTEIPADPVSKVLDATGAGDLYAAGFLFGLTQGLPVETCGRLGSLAAAEVISHIGARPESSLAKLAAARGLLN